MGQALREMAQVRDCLDVSVKHGFIDPLQSLQDKELKEIMVSLMLIIYEEDQVNIR